ncbi:MAG: hypothetical protein HY690_19020 [Chloroflexi bacterium]|nr:hypothetical protein [Chloroflexota bacterium]
MATHQQPARRAHRLQVQRSGDMVAVAAIPDVPNLAAPEGVAIPAPAGAAPGVEPRVLFGRSYDGNVLRQARIQSPLQHGRRHGSRRLKRNHLACRVDARVRPARRDHPHRVLEGRRERRLQLTLDSPAAGLARKPLVRGPLVLNIQTNRPVRILDFGFWILD